MQVEDHPYEYKDFEGTIPEGNYGAGNVIVWDKGFYHGLKSNDEKALLKELKAGDLKIVINGEKLKGAFALVQMKGDQGNAWLLIKKKDEYATTKDVLKQNKSVVSNKPIVPRKRTKAKSKPGIKKAGRKKNAVS
jgi:bifunctional non-homologous end joining protein LigD